MTETTPGAAAGSATGPTAPAAGLPARTVGDIASRGLLRCTPDTPLCRAARTMAEQRHSSVVVVEGERAIGIWTERDALRIDFSRVDSFDRPIRTVMSSPVRTIAATVTVGEAGVAFRSEGVRHLLVVDGDGAPVGMLSQTDVVLNHGVEQYLTLRDVRSVMASAPTLLPADLPFEAAAARLREAGAEAAIVLPDGNAGAGMLTERDLVRLAGERRAGGPVGAVASRPLVAVAATAPLLAARNLFATHGIRHLAVTGEDGAFVGLLSFSDIMATLQYEYIAQLNATLRERDEALLRSRRDLTLARQVIEASPEGVIITDEGGRIEYVNPAFTRLTGYTPDEARGRTPRFLQSGRHDRDFYARMWAELTAEGHWRGEIWNRRKNGDVYAEWLSINAIREEGTTAGRIVKYAAIFSDITERKRHEEEVRSLAYVDALTGLPNRRLLLDRLGLGVAAAHRHGTALAVMFLDLDLFKRINDTLGHGAGDRVLVETASRLLACVGEGDTVARMGGDEFVIVLPELADAADAAKVAETVIAVVRAPIDLAGRPVDVTASVGIAVYPEDGTDAETLLKHADQAMYRAKRIGRNRFQIHSPALSARSREMLTVEHRLRRALEAQEFALVYRVKVDMASGRMAGAEALIRWNHPELGEVLPGDFLPAVERMGMMPDLGEWVLRAACRQNRRWQDRGLPPVRLSVNVSSFQIAAADLPDVVGRVLGETGLEPRWLEVELGEGALLERPERAAQAVAALDRIGVAVAIDDFGARYACLGSLRAMPVHAVKIDRTFVAGLRTSPGDAELVRAIIALCHALGVRAVAEGVETREQAAVLREAGCDEIQGFLIGRAVPADELERLFGRDLPAGGTGPG
ncbi:EAL domain-containing protein [Azospirillum sp. A39]|uniref:EAL domain-containing protein n=1 Tax=Azospirillum sp. A39 TaxID=3462279 RepID=UPI00404543A2